MKCTLILAITLFAVVYSEEQYTAEHDGLDIEAIVKDPVQLKAYIECFTDKSECTDLTSHFKKDIAEAFQQGCAKCTQAQKHILRRFLEVLKEKMPEGYEAMKTKYDPENKYITAIEAVIKDA